MSYSFATARKEQEVKFTGVWMDLILEDEDGIRKLGGEVRVSSAKNPEFSRQLNRAFSRYRRSKGLKPNKEIPSEDAAEILRKEIPGGCLHDWRSIVGEDGEPLPYSAEAAHDALSQLKEFEEAVIRAIHRVDAAAEEEVEAVVGNSGGSSSGARSGEPSARQTES